MINNIFKGLFLLVAVALVAALFNLSRAIEQTNRFKVLTGENHLTVYDVKTHKYYLWIRGELFDKNINPIKQIPK